MEPGFAEQELLGPNGIFPGTGPYHTQSTGLMRAKGVGWIGLIGGCAVSKVFVSEQFFTLANT